MAIPENNASGNLYMQSPSQPKNQTKFNPWRYILEGEFWSIEKIKKKKKINFNFDPALDLSDPTGIWPTKPTWLAGWTLLWTWTSE